MIIGYARVSTKDQNLNLQLDALEKEGCKKIYKEVVSGAKSERPVLQDMLNQVRTGDVIVIWKLDRLGRSLKNLVDIVGQLIKNEVGLKSLHDNIDTTTPQGRLTFNIFASLAEFERDLISERTKAGLESARARGRFGGKPKGLSKQAEATACAAETLYKEGKLSVNQIAKQLGIAKNTLYKYLRHRNVEIGTYNYKSKSA
jgi:DNA invertase Pin-like site-specific DNA recombinase